MAMIDLNELTVFERVVARGSFAAAARDFGVPSSTLSRKVASLERRLGAPLMTRTTRSLQLTEAGRAYYARCAAIVSLASEAEQAVMTLAQSLRGTLRITAPRVFARSVLGPTISAYLRLHPEVRVEVSTEDRMVDLLREGFDLAFRVAPILPDTSLVARKIGTSSHDLCAAPSYLARHPPITRPQDLPSHNILAFGRGGRSEMSWGFAQGKRAAEQVSFTPRVLSNSEEALLELCVEGSGVALLPPNVADDELSRGRVQRLLAGYVIEPRSIFLVMPPEKQRSPLVRPYVDLVTAHLRAERGLID